MLILTFAVFRKVMAGLYKSISNSAINEHVQSNCSQKVILNNSITETQPVILEQMPDSLEKIREYSRGRAAERGEAEKGYHDSHP